MDFIDEKIIFFLRADSRRSFQDIGSKLNLSEAAIRQRVKKLVNEKTITKFTIKTNSPAKAVVCIVTDAKTPTKKIVEKLTKSQIVEVYEVSGKFSIICLIAAKNLELLNDVLEYIRSVNGVKDTETFTILKQEYK
jgi:Lrp/AsnC family transcriptional regulator, leucine-responsive regulatory protein